MLEGLLMGLAYAMVFVFLYAIAAQVAEWTLADFVKQRWEPVYGYIIRPAFVSGIMLVFTWHVREGPIAGFVGMYLYLVYTTYATRHDLLKTDRADLIDPP